MLSQWMKLVSLGLGITVLCNGMIWFKNLHCSASAFDFTKLLDFQIRESIILLLFNIKKSIATSINDLIFEFISYVKLKKRKKRKENLVDWLLVLPDKDLILISTSKLKWKKEKTYVLKILLEVDHLC